MEGAVTKATRCAVEHVIENIHLLQKHGFEGTLADARDELRSIYSDDVMLVLASGSDAVNATSFLREETK